MNSMKTITISKILNIVHSFGWAVYMVELAVTGWHRQCKLLLTPKTSITSHIRANGRRMSVRGKTELQFIFDIVT